ncbi:MAG TPA: sulfotransferase [Ideonella sp.]|nr:sulfotransferase [Ideonella sp.]
MAQLARELAGIGHVEASRELWQALQQAFPASPAGWVGLASLAARQQRWEEAMQGWTSAMERFPDRNEAVWKLGRARAMHRLGLDQEAEEVLRQALTLRPTAVGARQLLAHLLDRNGRLREALDVIEERLDECLTDLSLQFVHLKLLTRLGELPRALQAAHHALANTTSVDGLPGIVRLLPEMAAGDDLADLIRHSQERLAELAPNAAPMRQRQVAAELELRLLLLGRRLKDFLRAWADTAPTDVPARVLSGYRRMAERMQQPVSELLSQPRIFGIGLSKTATTSLSRATEMLGLFPAHYQNPITFEILDEEQALYFDACVDTPVSDLFERLYCLFPRAVFVHTVRQRDDWLPSLSRHHRFHFGTDDWGELRRLTGLALAKPALTEWSLYFRHADARAAADAHEERVRGFFDDKPADKLLTFDVFKGHGWPELCNFLGRPQPASIFPHENALRDGD